MKDDRRPSRPHSPAVILAATDRLARELRLAESAQALSGQGGPDAAGRPVLWRPSEIRTLQGWAEQIWLDTWPQEQILNAVEELCIWQDTIQRDRDSDDRLAKMTLARKARTAASLARQYRISLSDIEQPTQDEALLANWANAVEEKLRQRGYITREQAVERAAEGLRTGRIAPPEGLTFVHGHLQITPLQQYLMDAVAATGVPVMSVRTLDSEAAGAPSVSCHQSPSRNDQYEVVAERIAAAWSRAHDGGQGQGPGRTLIVMPGVDAPGADARRDALETALKEYVAPWLLQPNGASRPVPWRYARGRSLSGQATVSIALEICELQQYDNPFSVLSRILLSPVLWTPEQRQVTASQEERLRRISGSRYSANDLRLRPGDDPPEHARQAASRLQALIEDSVNMPEHGYPSQYAQLWNARLETLGWPGPQPLDTLRYQGALAMRRALDEFSAMDVHIGRCSQATALRWLREIINTRSLEPSAQHEQPILIVSPEDAAGIQAEQIFVVDATADEIPAPASRIAFLSKATLTRAGYEWATPNGSLAWARRFCAHLSALSPHIEVHAPQRDERGGQLSPTELFGVAWERPQGRDRAPTQSQAWRSQANMQWSQIEAAMPTMDDQEAAGLRGGAEIFADLGAAPLVAVCRRRLGVKPLQDPIGGLSPAAQGDLVHEVLQAFWAQTRRSEVLALMSREDIRAQLAEHLATRIQHHLPEARYGRRMQQIEEQRMLDVLTQWLAHEQRRVDPFEVIATEWEGSDKLAGIPIQYRIDRIDKVQTLGGPRHLIIDYKSGRRIYPQGWKLDQLTEPQLPLYATSPKLIELGISHADGIAFAHIKDGHPALASANSWRESLIEEAAKKPPPGPQAWGQQLTYWRTALERMAHGFRAGAGGYDRAHTATEGIFSAYAALTAWDEQAPSIDT